MKVLYISSPFYFDMDLSLVQQLKEKVELIYLIDVPNYADKSTAFNIQLNKKAGIFPAKAYKELLQFADFINLEKTFIINRTSKKTYDFSNIHLQFQISKFVEKCSPDIIHANGLLKPTFLWFLLANNSPKVLTVHDPFPHSGEESKKINLVRKLNFKYFKNFILLNKSQKQEFSKKLNIPLNQIYTSQLGAYTYLEHYLDQKIKEQKPVKTKILFFGRISPYKGIENLCLAIMEVRKSYPNVELTIAGSGKFDFDISPFQKYHNFNFINRYIETEELVSLLQSSSFVVCPYKDATQSGVIMTAFGLNKPVIATRVGGLMEMVEENITGLLIPPNDKQALSKAIIDLLDNQVLLKSLNFNIQNNNKNGKQSWYQISEVLIQDYRTIINKGKS